MPSKREPWQHDPDEWKARPWRTGGAVNLERYTAALDRMGAELRRAANGVGGLTILLDIRIPTRIRQRMVREANRPRQQPRAVTRWLARQRRKER